MFCLRRLVMSTTRWSGKQLHTSKNLQRAIIMDGRAISDDIQSELKTAIMSWVGSGKKRPKLVAIRVGHHPASKSYVERKMKMAQLVGIESYTVHLGEHTSQEGLLKEIDDLNRDESVDGILVQLPLPNGINEKEVCQAVGPKKDVDGFHLENLGNLTLDTHCIIPATALAVRELVVRSQIKTSGKNAVVVGRSKHVGLPIALLLHGDGKGETHALDMTTTICHRHTPPAQLAKFTKLADLVIAAAGVPGLITKEMIKPGACVIDVGISRVLRNGKYKMVGDVDFAGVSEVAGCITPVPGGVGPMTVAMLMKNTLFASMRNHEDKGYATTNLESTEAFPY